MKYHLVILKKPYIDTILAGKKTIESRFYQTRQKWLSQVNAGDKLFIKASSGQVLATATVAAIKVFDNLDPRQIAELKKQYNQQILGDAQYWQAKRNCRFGILCRLRDVSPITPRFIRKADWRAWVILTKTEHFGLVNFSEND
ncbi:MAG: ASCH domain-containing protein [Sedimentisphaerales bacterium]|nr:ASCH domain-containing protein [Sedimentisphaerales bacterium]